MVNLTRVQVVGTFVDSEGDPLAGKIKFTPSFDVLVDPDENVIVDNTPIQVTLDINGSFAVELPATNAPDVTPTGWTWKVDEPTGRSYNIPVDHATPGGVLDLVDAAASGVALPGTTVVLRGALVRSEDWDNTTPPTDGQAPIWNATAGKWRPGPVGGSLDPDLAAIAALDSATAGMLATDGGGWIRKTYAQVRTALGLATIATTGKLADATDVNVTGAAVGKLPAVSDASPLSFSLMDYFKVLAGAPDLLIAGTITRDANEAATSAPVVWPDGRPGVYTATTVSTAFPGAVDAYAITYDAAGADPDLTYTQSAVTRDAAGAVTARPAVTVA